MKTKIIRWWENWLKWILSCTMWAVISFVVTIGFSILLFDPPNGESVWTYRIETQSNINLPFIFVVALVISFSISALIGTVLHYALWYRTLFDYEKRKDLIPTIDGRIVSFISKKDVDKIDWIENREIDLILYFYPEDNGDYKWVYTFDNYKANVLIHKNWVNKFKEEGYMNENGGVNACWKFRWNGRFFEIYPVHAYIYGRQLELDFGKE